MSCFINLNSSRTFGSLCFASNDSSSISFSRPHHFTKLIFSLFEHFAFYFTAAFISLGLVLNVLLLLVFLLPHRRQPRAFGLYREQSMVRRSSVASTTTRLYYVLMAWGELGAVLFKDLWIFFLSTGVPALLRRRRSWSLRTGASGADTFLGWANAQNTMPACSVAIFLSYVHELTANNVLVVFEIERVLVLYLPFLARKWLTRSRALAIVALVSFTDVAVCSCVFQSSRVISVPLTLDQQRSTGREKETEYSDGSHRSLKLCVFSSAVPFWNAWAALVFFSTFLWPAAISIVCSALITFKIVHHQRIQRELSEHMQVQRQHNLQSLNQQYISRRELNVCVTYLVRACATVVFYLPVSALRITAVLLPLFLNSANTTATATNTNTTATSISTMTANKLRESQSMGRKLWAENPDAWAETRSEYALQLLGAGLLAHLLVIPVHCINFVLCCARVRGFAHNVLRLLTLRSLEHYNW